MNNREKCNLCGLAVIFALLAVAARGANVSSLETDGFLDNGEIPSLRIATEEGVAIPYAGEWMGGRCELFVDGVSVGSSDSAPSLHTISGDGDALKTYRLTLESESGSITKFVTFVPSPDFCSAMHTLESDEANIDARPVGTVRRLNIAKTMPLSWSSLWSQGADMAKVEICQGYSTTGDSLGTLIEKGASVEGVCAFSPRSAGLTPGQYTLTHFDGVETLFAYVNITGTGLLMIVR